MSEAEQPTGGAPAAETPAASPAPVPAAATPPAGGKQEPSGNVTPPVIELKPGEKPNPTPAKPGEAPVKPDAAAMKAYLAEKAKDVSLEGKSEDDIAKLYDETKAKEPADPNAFKVPDKYKEKGWAAKVKSLDDVYKQLDELDALKGKKTVRPDLSKSTPEEREAYYAQGRPKDLGEYKFTDGIAVDDTVKGAVPQMLNKYGIDAYTGNEIIKDYQAMEQALVAKQYDPADFDSTMKTAFGDDYKEMQGRTRKFIEGLMNEGDQKALDMIPNVYLGTIYRTLGNTVQAVSNMMKQYGVKETNIAHFMPAGATPASSDIGTVRTQLRAEIKKLDASKGPYPSAKIADLKAKLDATYKNDTRRTDASR